MTGKLTSLFCFALFVCITSCSKKSGNSDGNPPPPPPQDSLGAGWQKIIIDTTSGSGLEDIFFPDNNTGYVGGYSNMFKSSDGGLTWKRLTLPAGVSQLFNIFFLDSLQGWAGEVNNLIKTTDGGKNWKKISMSGIGFGDVQFLNPRLGYLVGNNGLFMSTDSGNTWTKTPGSLPTQGTGLFFTDSLKGWVTTSVQIFNTTDGGKTFTPQAEIGGFYIIKFIDAQHGWAAGGPGVYRTINGGATWSAALSESFGFGDVDFFDVNNGFVSGSQDIYKTADGGITNIPIVHVIKGNIIEIHSNDIHHCWAINSFGWIYRYNQ